MILLKRGGNVPKDTFNNLSAGKRRRIFDAAVQEFSTRRFSDASINQIVKVAGIPRGSFYQYFDSKEDIYLYMSGEIAKEQQVATSHVDPLNPDASALDEFIYKAKVSLELYKMRPKYQQIALLIEKDDSEFITKLRSLSAENLNRVKELFERDKQRGLIRPDVDSSLVIEMVYTLTMKEYFEAGLDSDLFVKRMNEIIKVILEGIARIGD